VVCCFFRGDSGFLTSAGRSDSLSALVPCGFPQLFKGNTTMASQSFLGHTSYSAFSRFIY